MTDETPEPTCTCGEPTALLTVHRTDGPCFLWDGMQERIDAAKAAREVLKSSFPSSREIPIDEIVMLATWFIEGEVTAEDEPAIVSVPFVRPPMYEDHELPEPDAEGRDGPDYDRAAGDEGR